MDGAWKNDGSGEGLDFPTVCSTGSLATSVSPSPRGYAVHGGSALIGRRSAQGYATALGV